MYWNSKIHDFCRGCLTKWDKDLNLTFCLKCGKRVHKKAIFRWNIYNLSKKHRNTEEEIRRRIE